MKWFPNQGKDITCLNYDILLLHEDFLVYLVYAKLKLKILNHRFIKSNISSFKENLPNNFI